MNAMVDFRVPVQATLMQRALPDASYRTNNADDFDSISFYR